MAVSVVMPALEMAQETGKLLAWLKKEGDSVKKGEPLLEIETDKVTVEVEAPADGVLSALKARAGADVPVGQTIAWIVAPGETPPAESAPTVSGRAMSATVGQVSELTAAPNPTPARIRASPKARRMAQDLGVDLSRVRGTGPDGAITGDDVQAAAKSTLAPAVLSPASAAAAAPAFEPAAALSNIARLMAERTTQSWTSAPHFFLVREIEAGGLNSARSYLGPVVERDHKVKLTHTDLLVALVARVIARHPKFNATWTGNGIQVHPEVNISVAAAVKDGVVGVVIPRADSASLGAIAERRADLSERARAGHLRPPDVSGGTFTISNLGMYEVDAFTAIITPPQAAILAVGAITDRVIAVDGKPAVRSMMTLTLSSDHRVVDGAQAALFLKDVVAALREPAKWL
ncbi:MAG TPA: dihydrolipoamide acetyltransferase family protein [Bryobacteraceae bacterium]|nr:dihydrolipoamide acetyltransferase family protein [Bryobacteraceae bacterium]